MDKRIRACFETIFWDIEEIEKGFISRNFDTVKLRKAKRYLFEYFTEKKKIRKFQSLMDCYAEISTASIECKRDVNRKIYHDEFGEFFDNALQCLRVIVSWLCKFRGRLEDVQ